MPRSRIAERDKKHRVNNRGVKSADLTDFPKSDAAPGAYFNRPTDAGYSGALCFNLVRPVVCPSSANVGSSDPRWPARYPCRIPVPKWTHPQADEFIPVQKME